MSVLFYFILFYMYYFKRKKNIIKIYSVHKIYPQAIVNFKQYFYFD